MQIVGSYIHHPQHPCRPRSVSSSGPKFPIDSPSAGNCPPPVQARAITRIARLTRSSLSIRVAPRGSAVAGFHYVSPPPFLPFFFPSLAEAEHALSSSLFRIILDRQQAGHGIGATSSIILIAIGGEYHKTFARVHLDSLAYPRDYFIRSFSKRSDMPPRLSLFEAASLGSFGRIYSTALPSSSSASSSSSLPVRVPSIASRRGYVIPTVPALYAGHRTSRSFRRTRKEVEDGVASSRPPRHLVCDRQITPNIHSPSLNPLIDAPLPNTGLLRPVSIQSDPNGILKETDGAMRLLTNSALVIVR